MEDCRSWCAEEERLGCSILGHEVVAGTVAEPLVYVSKGGIRREFLRCLQEEDTLHTEGLGVGIHIEVARILGWERRTDVVVAEARRRLDWDSESIVAEGSQAVEVDTHCRSKDRWKPF